jgi:DNA-binding IclR family transcriptional regulator
MMQEMLEEESGTGSIVKSAGRVFEVLELFRRARRQMSAAEVGQALGYPKSSTNALLKSLVTLGYLVFETRTLRYFPSLSVTQLGDWIPSVVLASRDAFDIISEVQTATQETVTLSVKSELSWRVLRVAAGTYPISLRMMEGFDAPLVGTAVGTAILSQLQDDAVVAIVERWNARAKRKGERADPAKVVRDAREVRNRGYSVAYDAVFEDTGAIAVPFPSAVDGFPMAIGVGGLRERIRRNEALIYRSIRASLAGHLGGRPRRSRRSRTAG